MVVITQDASQYGDIEGILSELSDKQDEIDSGAERLRHSLSNLHKEQDEFESAVKSQKKLLVMATKALRTPSVPGRSHSSPSVEHAARLERLRNRLSNRSLQGLMPCSGGLFVEVLLGGLNVRFMRKSERLSFKTEYEKLKLKLAPGLVVLCLVCLFFERNRWLHMILQLCLTAYYVTLAARENILRVNGSNIRTWWVIHHYFTMAQCVLLTTWPDNSSYAKFRKGLHLFGLYNAVLQIFQTRYQMARLYALRSLGMVGEMEVASSDSTQIHWSERMAVLLPLILLGQAMQAGQAFNLLCIFQEHPNEFQILLLAMLFLANFLGNFYTTMVVLNQKRKRRR